MYTYRIGQMKLKYLSSWRSILTSKLQQRRDRRTVKIEWVKAC